MAAAWSFSRKDGVEATSRLVSIRSLDGRLVRCRFALRFQRAITKDVAESAADEASMLLAEIIGEEIVQDALPFDGAELVHRLKARGGNRDGRVAAYNVSELDLVPDPSRSPRPGGNHSPSRKPASNPPPARPSGFIPVGRSSSPSVPATRPSAPSGSARAHTLWATALASCPTGAGTDRIGQLLSAPL